MNLYYEDNHVRLYHGDARDTMPVAPGTVSCVVTSPPYNAGIGYDTHDDVMPWPDYIDLATQACVNAHRAMHPGARMWVNVVPVVPEVPVRPGVHSGSCAKRRVSLLQLWQNAMAVAGIDMWDYVAWTSAREPGTAWGSWQSPSSPNLRGGWEVILAGYRDTWSRKIPQQWKGWQDTVGAWTPLTSNVWRMQGQHRRDRHPAPFPPELPPRCIRLSTWPDELVLDPFVGEGTTLLAARSLGRRAVGIELSERYCEIAATRLSQACMDFGGAA